MLQLAGKIALITGAGKGIGAAIATGFAREGALVILNELPGATYVQELANQLITQGFRAEIRYADMSDVGAVRKLYASIQAEHGRLDILVNNAGITGWADFFETEEALFDKVMALNLKGTFFSSLEAAKLMRSSGGGSIIQISSVVSTLSVKNLICYAASKGAIEAMTKQMAVELAPYHIRVNAFGPGPINTERNLAEDPLYRDHWGRVVPLQRTGEPEEMIGPALFLASDASSYVTGQVFFADGGWSVQGKIAEDSLDAQLKNTKDR
ncbi:MAG: SDR family oxidoreductase [Saprospiraceae bacterium]|nr:SDR family oxidoreductase [Saprospiraceae bacterium]